MWWDFTWGLLWWYIYAHVTVTVTEGESSRDWTARLHTHDSMLTTYLTLTLRLGHLRNFSTPPFTSRTVEWNSVLGQSKLILCTALYCTALYCTALDEGRNSMSGSVLLLLISILTVTMQERRLSFCHFLIFRSSNSISPIPFTSMHLSLLLSLGQNMTGQQWVEREECREVQWTLQSMC